MTIRQLREQKRWTQEHLARAAGVSLRTIQRLEAGKGVSNETILNVAAAMEISPDEIKQPPTLDRFYSLVVLLVLFVCLILAVGWIIYTPDFSTQNSYFLNYRTFLAISSLVTSVTWGIACGWFIINRQPRQGLLMWTIGMEVLFLTYNLLPFVQWPSDQYSAAFQWLVTGLGPATLSLLTVCWLWGNLKRLVTQALSQRSVTGI